MKFAFILGAILAVSTNSLQVKPEKTPDSNFSREEEKKCKTEKGKYKKVGFMGTYKCIHSFSDAFKSCKSSDDCKGDCIVEDQYDPVSFCKPDDNIFGCYATIEEWNKNHVLLCRD